MKLQKHFAKKIGDKSYYKYVIVLPEDIVKNSSLKQGDELEAEVKNKKIILKKRKNS